MDDELLAARARGGDLDSFGQLYDRYFHRVYDFAWRLLRDADGAAAVTQDVFAFAASGLASIPRTMNFKSWLFAVAHRAALTRADAAGPVVANAPAMHEEAFGSFGVPDPSRINQPALIGEDHELAALVWEGAASLGARDYALLDLHLRQGLDSAELAPILGASKANAATMVTRMRTAAGDVIKTYIVARRGTGDCPALRNVLAPFSFPPYTDAIRIAVDAHTKECSACQQTRKRIAPPLEILGAFAAVAAPMALKGDMWRTLSSEWSAAAAARGGAPEPGGVRMAPSPYETGARAAALAGGSGLIAGGGFGDGGWVTSGAAEWDRNRILLFAGAAAALLAVAFLGAVLVFGALGGGNGGGSGLGIGATRTAAVSRTATTSGTPLAPVIATATVNLTPSATARPSETATSAAATPSPVPASATPAVRQTPTATPKPGKATATPKPAATATKCPGGVCPTPTH